MDRGLAVVMTAIAGGFIALQAPINGLLSKSTGSLPAAAISFSIGTLALIGLVVITGGIGGVAEVRGVPWYYLIGGLLGAVYVTTALIAVKSLGAGGVTAATIGGQLALSLLIDRLGILGVEQRPLSWDRIAGVVLLAAGTFLIIRE